MQWLRSHSDGTMGSAVFNGNGDEWGSSMVLCKAKFSKQHHPYALKKKHAKDGFRGGNVCYSWFKKKKKRSKHTQACRNTALKLTMRQRIKNCTRMVLDLSSPASSESVMFLSRTGAGGLETRLTEAIGEPTCLPSPRYKWINSRRRWFVRDAGRFQTGKDSRCYMSRQRDSKQTLSSFISF